MPPRLALLLLAASAIALAAEPHPILPIGSPAPDFSLPGVDGQTHRLADYAATPVLAIVFACNHCPISQLYEQRIQHLYDSYRAKGVAVIAIQPNAPEALRIDELDSSDMSDTLAEMKIRAAYKHLTYPYLYDGDTQSVARAYGPQATPHIFIFDRQRRLRYEGRIDNSYREELVKSHDAQDAIEALLAGRPIEVTHTGVFGCSTKWKEKEAERLAALRKLEEMPVTLDPASAADLTALMANAGHKLTLVGFWSANCAQCADQLAGLEMAYRMYNVRGLQLVTVSLDGPDRRSDALVSLQKLHATSRNLVARAGDAVAPARGGLPYTVLLGPDGKVLYTKTGLADMLDMRRAILANFDWEYEGFSRYWAR